MTPDAGSTRRQIGGTQGGNENQKTERSNENRKMRVLENEARKTPLAWGEAAELHNGRPPKKTEPRRRDGLLAGNAGHVVGVKVD